MLIAHRGYSFKYTDNSKEAFIAALKKFDMIELDIHICGTNELVIYHDSLIDSQHITTMHYNVLKSKGILSLDEYFREINPNILPTYIDVKGNMNVVKNLITYLHNANYIDLDKIYVASFNTSHLLELRNSSLNVKCGLITANMLTHDELVQYMYLDFFAFSWDQYDNNIYELFQKKNKQVFLYTCHDTDEYNYICNNLKYDGMISNICINKS